MLELTVDQKYDVFKEFILNVVKKELKDKEVKIKKPYLVADINVSEFKANTEKYKIQMELTLMDEKDYKENIEKE